MEMSVDPTRVAKRKTEAGEATLAPPGGSQRSRRGAIRRALSMQSNLRFGAARPVQQSIKSKWWKVVEMECCLDFHCQHEPA